ncbi:extracellular solute-binding protein [Paenibacillus sp. CF384]|uniref:extracellular solute-binding protein n=1 Tax=Paenibacillus sp. CF384 TaxID=1884382 RepID=UPI000896EA7E|nr:extracellular solute-binding protein [Paenibacillus sp. CF384]SDW06463.1 carbohydrate ABC transporter substrate-binding protein, CUT1 family [Paenibacillus sp. CF384]
MNRMKAVAVTLSSLVLVCSLLAGCSSGNSSKASNKNNSEASGVSTENSGETKGSIKLDIIETGNNLPTPDKDFIKQNIDKAIQADVNLTVYASGDDYQNQLNVRLASGNFPDLFQVSDRAALKQFVDQGLVLDLTPYMDKLKPVKDFIGDESLKKTTINGKVFAVPKAPSIPYNTYWIRKDWLDKLGLQPPSTIDEFLNVVKSFAEQDPDGNGKNDTLGLTGSKLSAFAPIFGAFGVGDPNTFYVKDGKLGNSMYDPAMIEALGFIKKLIDTGAVDPEIMANTGLQHQEKAIKGQAGIVWIDWPNLSKDQFTEQIKKVNPNANWIQLAPPKGPGGQFDGPYDLGGTTGIYAIPKALENDKDKLQKVFDLLNFVSGKEGSMLVQFGINGTHYKLEGDKVTPTELMGKEAGFTWLYQFTGRPELTYLETKFAPQSTFIQFANSQPRLQILNGFLTNPEGYNPADTSRFIDEEFVKFIYGNNPFTNYNSFLQTLESSMNFKTYLDASTKQLEELGYGK